MNTGFHSSVTQRCDHRQVSYREGSCRQSTSSCQSNLRLVSYLMKWTTGCHSVSKSRSKSAGPSASLTLLILASLLLHISTVNCLPISPDNQQIEISVSPAQVPKHHHRHHRHHLLRERAKHHHHHKHHQLESVEVLDTSGSLSIVIPLDVLRQNMMLGYHRQRLQEATDKQVKFNTEFLEKIG